MVLVLCAVLVSIGVYGVLTRRDLVAVLASVEIMLGGANVFLLAVATTRVPESAASVGSPAVGAGVALLVLVVAAAEAAVGLAILSVLLLRRRRSRTDEIAELQG